MRHASLCSDDVRLEFYPDKGVPCAVVTVDGDPTDYAPVNCEPSTLKDVLHGIRCHLAGGGWMCTIQRAGASIELDLWREGAAKRRCTVSLQRYEEALEQAFGPARRAYAA